MNSKLVLGVKIMLSLHWNMRFLSSYWCLHWSRFPNDIQNSYQKGKRSRKNAQNLVITSVVSYLLILPQKYIFRYCSLELLFSHELTSAETLIFRWLLLLRKWVREAIRYLRTKEVIMVYFELSEFSTFDDVIDKPTQYLFNIFLFFIKRIACGNDEAEDSDRGR